MFYRRRAAALLLAAMILSAGVPAVGTPRTNEELVKIILHSRHLGAHGLGYNDQSLIELSEKIINEDIPDLIKLLDETKIRVGAQFALASQCNAAIQPVREAAMQSAAISALDAGDIMELIAGFSRCAAGTQGRARAARVEIDAFNKDRQTKRAQELQEKSAEDARVQRNALKINDPAQRKILTRAEREEVFRRSIKAAGLENPQTPEQKALVERMYRTMVLDEPPASKNQ
jgi:hypothetical protein